MPLMRPKSRGSESPPVTGILLKKTEGLNSTSLTVLRSPDTNPFCSRSSQGVFVLVRSGSGEAGPAARLDPQCWQYAELSGISLPQCGQNTEPPHDLEHHSVSGPG